MSGSISKLCRLFKENTQSLLAGRKKRTDDSEIGESSWYWARGYTDEIRLCSENLDTTRDSV